MLMKRIVYLFFFLFCIWLALATRSHGNWFPNLIRIYGGDVIWAAAFLFLLKGILIKTSAYKLAITCYVLGILDEFSQLLTFSWIVAIRETYIGRLMLGVGFVWSDLVCYAVGTLLALFCIILFEKFIFHEEKLKTT